MQPQNDLKELDQDLVFERVLGHEQVENQEEWRETSQCWICERHNVFQVKMNEFLTIKDPEYGNVMQISTVDESAENLATYDKQHEPIISSKKRLVSTLNVRQPLDATLPSSRTRQRSRKSLLSRKTLDVEPPQIGSDTHYRFDQFTQGQHLVPVGKALNYENVSAALEKDKILNMQGISSTPFKVRHMQTLL